MKKEDLLRLIEHWYDFEAEAPVSNLENFALWLLRRSATVEDRLQKERNASYLLSRMERYSKAHIKDLFSDLPLNSYDDFLLLNTVYHHQDIPKKELYALNIYEMNSGTPVVNRLKREGLLIDQQSATDKRVYLLNITDQGRAVRNTAFERLGGTLPHKYAGLTDEVFENFYQAVIQLEKNHALLLNRDVESSDS